MTTPARTHFRAELQALAPAALRDALYDMKQACKARLTQLGADDPHRAGLSAEMGGVDVPLRQASLDAVIRLGKANTVVIGVLTDVFTVDLCEIAQNEKDVS